MAKDTPTYFNSIESVTYENRPVEAYISDIHSYRYVRAYGPQGKKEARDTLALLARDFVPCTPVL